MNPTRLKLITTGAHLFHLQGYNHTGLSQILNEAKVAKGSFYFHFKSKQDFALSIIDYFNEAFLQLAAKTLKNKSLSPEQRLFQYHQNVVIQFKSLHYKSGCPIGNFAQEMASSSPEFQDKLSSSLSLMESCFVGLIKDIEQPSSSIGDGVQLAQFIVNSWQGAVLRMKTEQNSYSLQNWYLQISKMLFSSN